MGPSHHAFSPPIPAGNFVPSSSRSPSPSPRAASLAKQQGYAHGPSYDAPGPTAASSPYSHPSPTAAVEPGNSGYYYYISPPGYATSAPSSSIYTPYPYPGPGEAADGNEQARQGTWHPPPPPFAQAYGWVPAFKVGGQGVGQGFGLESCEWRSERWRVCTLGL